MRNRFATHLTALAAKNPKLVLLSGDIGNRLFDGFKQRFPNRFFNCGVAEANMTGIAAGLALSGFHPITYTIAPFVTTRCLEQIRVDLCYHNLPALIVGVGAGLSYSSLGPTHHSCEDLAFLRALPNMTVFAPGDPQELERCLELSLALPGPSYLRLGKKGEPEIHAVRSNFELGQAVQLRKGTEVALLTTGTPLSLAYEAASLLEKESVSVALYSFPTVKPLDTALLQTLFTTFPLVCTVEEHSLFGGFGSAVAEYKVDAGLPGRLKRVGTPDRFLDHTGGAAREEVGLDAESIKISVLRALEALDVVGC